MKKTLTFVSKLSVGRKRVPQIFFDFYKWLRKGILASKFAGRKCVIIFSKKS